MIFEGRNQIPYSYGCYGYTRGSGKVWHGGQDIVGLDDTTVRAVEGGKVLRSRIVTGKSNATWEWGNYVTIQTASGEQHIYAHLEQRLVQAGETVQAGQAIGIMGNTGNAAGGYKHVHFERRKADGRTAIDPSAKSGCANGVGIYGEQPAGVQFTGTQSVAALSAGPCVMQVGPASSGDRAALRALAESLGLGFAGDETGLVRIGPASAGDQRTVLAKAAALGLAYGVYEPEAAAISNEAAKLAVELQEMACLRDEALAQAAKLAEELAAAQAAVKDHLQKLNTIKTVLEG